jgi:D-3-phosphoglycerate dehydrogenase / 2-oxoglutarate reductase
VGLDDGISVFVSTTPFGVQDRAPVDWLTSCGWNVAYNSTGRRLTPFEVADLARDCDGIIAGTEDLGPLLDANDRLRIISRVGVGLDSVPLRRCRERRIAVSYTPQAVTAAVAEFTIGLMLTLARQIGLADREIRQARWRRAVGTRIGEATVGIVGFGRIGSVVGQLVSAFHPREILVRDILDKRAETAILPGAREAGFADILETCDIVSLHVPLTASTHRMMGAAELRRMRRGALLINTSRGAVVDETALFEALQAGQLGGAALDVFDWEPYAGPLAGLDNVVLTAHMASCSVDCRARMERDATAEVIRFFRGGMLKNPVPDEEYGIRA